MPLPFRFKRFLVEQCVGVHPVGTDGVLLGAWADTTQARTILDIGTGTGLIALMLAQRTEYHSDIAIHAVEMLPVACACAQDNFAHSPWSGRMVVVEQRIQDFAKSSGARFDLIVSNPPFFSGITRSPDPNRLQSRHAISLGVRDLLVSATQLLTVNGRFCTILPCREGQFLQEQGALVGLYCTRLTRVNSRRGKPVERLLVQLERNPYPYVRSDLIIEEQTGMLSADFRELTASFYANSR